MGVFHPDLVGIQVRVLQRLGAQHAIVVWGRDNMDEASLGAGTLVGELINGEIREYDIHPEDFGFKMASNRSFRVSNAQESQQKIRQAITPNHADDNDPARDIVTFNAGIALYGANVANSIEAGIQLAKEAIFSGSAMEKMNQLIQVTQQLGANNG